MVQAFTFIGFFIFMAFHSQATSLSLDPHKEVLFEHSLYPVEKPKEEGHIKVSEIHNIFYATYGNPNGIPVVILHGGPGGGCNDAMTCFFDLTRWNVVMFDQRGAMRSEPFACMDENSPQHSIADIDVLRKHLGIEKWVVFGGSWGSTLALLYGQEYPQDCMGFILRGIFLGREQDYLHVIYGTGKVFPEAYEPFLEYIPEEERSDLLSAYYNRIIDPNPQIHMEAARTFMRFATICSTHLPNPESLEKILQNDKLILSVTKTFLHYSINHFFFEAKSNFISNA
jgi:proline iminopeptidase